MRLSIRAKKVEQFDLHYSRKVVYQPQLVQLLVQNHKLPTEVQRDKIQL